LRVALGRETPLHQSPQARAQLCHFEKDQPTVAGQASGFRSGSAFWYTSQRMLVGTEIVTDKNILRASSKGPFGLRVTGEGSAG
jgi:hypothetical protein